MWFGSIKILLIGCVKNASSIKRVVFIKVTRCFSLGDWVWRRSLDQSSDDDASISDYLHPFSEFIKCGKLV